jgi:hypothetical protein
MQRKNGACFDSTCREFVETCPEPRQRSFGMNGGSVTNIIRFPFPSSMTKGTYHFVLFLVMILSGAPRQPLALAQAGGGVPRVRQPPLVRITGAFVPVADTQQSELRTLVVTVKETKWRLRIREIKALTAANHHGWGLLKDLFPPRLRLAGPSDLLARLQQEDIAGILIILEGRLYIGDHMLYVTAVTVPEPND